MSLQDQNILNEIISYYREKNVMPPIKYLKEIFQYKSRNAIYKHLKKIEQNGYLNKINGKFMLNENSFLLNNGIKVIKIINSNKTISLYLDKEKEYIGFILKNNFFVKNNLIKRDILIIEKSKKIKDNDLGLFLINDNYRIMNYHYQDGFYVLEDNEQVILNKIKLIGKVVMAERYIK